MIAGMHADTPVLVKGGVGLGTQGIRKAPCQAVSSSLHPFQLPPQAGLPGHSHDVVSHVLSKVFLDV